MATIELNQANFTQIVGENAFVFVDFWAPWCAPCRSFAPTFEAASERHGDIVFAKVNTEIEQELAASFGIRSIPTLMVFRERIIVYAEAGALPAQALDQLIAQARALDMAQVRQELAKQEQDGA